MVRAGLAFPQHPDLSPVLCIHSVKLPPLTVSLSFVFSAGCILHTLNGKSSFGLNLSGIEDYLSSPDHYPLTLVFKQHAQEDVKGRKKFTVCLKELAKLM